MQKTIFRTKSTIPCRDDAELASEQTYQTAFTAWQEQPGNEFSFRHVNVYSCAQELLGQNRNVETIGIETGKVTSLNVTANFQSTWNFISPSVIIALFGIDFLCGCIFFVGRFALLFCA